MEALGSNYSKSKILLVDDTEANLSLLTSFLDREGYGIITAPNGKEALQKAKDKNPDLIMLDIMMPEMNGYEVCKKLKADEITHRIPVIFWSSLTDIYNKLKAFQVGGVDYITKPFDKDEVLARIALHIRLKQFQEEKEERIKVLRERELELTKLNRQKDELMRIVSHDIKNPLTGIIGVVNVLLESDDIKQEEARQMLQMIESSSNELLDLVMEILDKNMLRREDQKLELKEVDLVEVLDEVISINAPNAKLKRIGLYLKSNIESCFICVDVRKIKQIFNNLVINALKFTPSKGRVSIHIDKTEHSTVLCKVIDSGIGIPEDIIGQLFTEEDETTTVGTGGEIGTGLGLDLVQYFVELHKGKVWVESEVNVGTTFFIELPLNTK